MTQPKAVKPRLPLGVVYVRPNRPVSAGPSPAPHWANGNASSRWIGPGCAPPSCTATRQATAGGAVPLSGLSRGPRPLCGSLWALRNPRETKGSY